MPNTVSFRRRHLPHWMVADASYFVTIKLKGSMPAEAQRSLERERAEFLEDPRSEVEMDAFRRARFVRVENILDSMASGVDHLRNPAIARIVFDAFQWFEEKKGWRVFALTIMPNHVHAVMRNDYGRNDRLNEDLGVLKGFTAREANKQLGLTGRAFWMNENFDHWCRTDAHVVKAVRYCARNTIKAGLANQWQEWPWTRIHPDYVQWLA